MDVGNFFLGRGKFKSPAEIVATVRESPNFEPSREGDSAEPLLIFQTSTQQTWLVATNQRLYCILDDLNRSFTRVQWSMPKGRLIADGTVVVPISTQQTRSKSDRSGLVDIEKHKSWYFSRNLFASEPIENRIRRLIAENMLPQS
jgi:hypothetical protein